MVSAVLGAPTASGYSEVVTGNIFRLPADCRRSDPALPCPLKAERKARLALPHIVGNRTSRFVRLILSHCTGLIVCTFLSQRRRFWIQTQNWHAFITQRQSKEDAMLDYVQVAWKLSRSKEARARPDIASKPVVARNVIHHGAQATISWQTNAMSSRSLQLLGDTCETSVCGLRRICLLLNPVTARPPNAGRNF